MVNKTVKGEKGMKKVLVAGATGGMGYALVQELRRRNIEVIAFARGEQKLKELFNNMPGVAVRAGDALLEKDIIHAADGADVLFHAISFPYQEWETTHPLALKNMLRAAKGQEAKFALVDNIYAYGRQTDSPIDEAAKKEPHTKKGSIRLEMENVIKTSGVPYLIVHMPDFYGPNAGNTVLNETLKNVALNKTANFIGSPSLAKEFLFTEDGAKAMIELALRENAYNQNWNIPGVSPITGNEMKDLLQTEWNYSKNFRTVSKTMIKFMALFNPFMKELIEMMYLYEQPVLLSGKKYEEQIGPLARTSYKQGIKITLDYMKSNR